MWEKRTDCGQGPHAVFVTSTLKLVGYEAVEFVGQIDISSRHWVRPLFICGPISQIPRLARIASGGTPPSPLSFGIMGLGRKSCKVFGFKGLIGKISRNKDLACQRALKMILGQLRGASWWTTHLETAPIRSLLLRSVGCMSINFDRGRILSRWGRGEDRKSKFPALSQKARQGRGTLGS